MKGKVNKYIYAIVDGAAELSLDDVVPSVTVVGGKCERENGGSNDKDERLVSG